MYKKVADTINSKSQLARLLIVLFGSVIILFVWYQFSFSSISAGKENVLSRHEDLQKNINTIENMTSNSDRLLYESHMVSADDFASLLKSLLQDNSELELISLKKQPVDLKKDVDDNLKGLHDVLGQDVVATDVELTLRGDYFGVMKYLKSVEESSAESVYWQKLTYSVVDYPTAEVALVLRTIGR